MKNIVSLAKLLVLVIVLVGAISVFISYYSFIFSKVVTGPIKKVERVDQEMIIASRGSGPLNPQVFSFAVSIEDMKTHEIMVASTEDRQWAAVEPGQCATARFYPYPFWEVEKAGTYHNARLMHLVKDCDSLSK